MYAELIKSLREDHGKQYFARDMEAADAIEELLSERDEVNADSWKRALEIERDEHRWIPVTERLPDKRDHYLTVSIEPWFGTTVVDTMRWSGVWMYDGRQTEATVTHWMPLPEPPKEET